jgi:UDP-sugar transporter A1/2/3
MMTAPTPDNLIAWTSMGALAVQFGIMPTLQKKCVPPKICRSTVVMAQEVAKFILSTSCLFLMLNPYQRQQALMGWSVWTWWRWAAIPAFLYSVQNYAKLMAYQHLPAVTYSVLNQTKTLSTAFFCYLLLGVRQSPLQMAALVLLLFSALVIEEVVQLRMIQTAWWDLLLTMSNMFFTESSSSSSLLSWKKQSILYRIKKESLFSATVPRKAIAVIDTTSTPNESLSTDDAHPARDPYHVSRGVFPLLLANLTSGLAAALGQQALQHQERNLYLYGMELSSASFLMVLVSLLWTNDGKQIRREGITCHWKLPIGLPIGAHALGGMLVGFVTKYAGSVQKGFALIFGVLLSGLFQKWLSHEDVTKEQIFGGILACISLWMYSSFPPPR